jgi:hypothetical protein
MHCFEGCTFFCIHYHASCRCSLFPAFINGACAHTPYVFLVYADCIVLVILEMNFWSMGELIVVWRCWIPVTIYGQNFSDNNDGNLVYNF